MLRREWLVVSFPTPAFHAYDCQAEGTAVPCMVSQFLESGGSDEMEQVVKVAAASIYSGMSLQMYQSRQLNIKQHT